MTDQFKEDIFVSLINLPDGTNEAVSSNEDGTFSIFINARLSRDGQLRAYNHALKHIQRNDFHKEDIQDVQTIEHSVHKSPKDMKAIPGSKYISEIKRLQQERQEARKE